MERRIAWTLALIEQRPLASIRVATLAGAVNLSRSRFAHLFRREVGISPARYLHAVRMLRARALLEQTFLTVKEVSALVGCSDASHFSRDFRRFHGLTPRECRSGADRATTAASEPVTGMETGATAARIAALANERLNRPTKRQPRARAPDVEWETGYENNDLITM